MRKIIVLLIGLLYLHPIVQAQNKSEPVRVIFDSDMGPDYDDVGAITLLHSFADSGKANILATIASTKYEGVAAVFEVLNTYFNRPNIPIGVPKGKAVETKDFQNWSDTLRANYPHTINSNQEVMDAVDLYRKILSEQPDNSVTIITVGFLTNIANLLQSQPDQYSDLKGSDLVKKKVKQLVSMAGKFPSGKEFNIEEDAKAAKFAFENIGKRVIYSGFEIGQKIKSGLPLINNDTIVDSPVKDVFRICINMTAEDKEGRMSWDQTAVLVGVLGHEPWYTLKSGSIVVDEEGNNSWTSKKKNQYHLVEKLPSSTVQTLINNLMMHQPMKPL
jgi:inosine-uridine nucleoside N-ribohydrolase